MHIQHEDSDKGGRFYIQNEAGADVAEMDYTWSGDNQFTIEHTEVDASLEGKGVGKELVSAGVDFAREKGATILPVCPYAKHVMEQTPDYADVLAKA